MQTNLTKIITLGEHGYYKHCLSHRYHTDHEAAIATVRTPLHNRCCGGGVCDQLIASVASTVHTYAISLFATSPSHVC